MLRAVLQLAALVSCFPMLARAGYCDHPDWDTVFADEFSGDTLNASTWTMLGNTVPNDSSCRSAMCLFENVRVEGGALVLTALRQQRGWANFTTGAVNSKDKVFFQATRAKPFRLCVSGRLPGGGGTGAGLWPAFWMMPNDKSCWPDHGEQDIMEMINGDGVSHATYHVSEVGAPPCSYKDTSEGGSAPIKNFDTEYHEYAIERTLDTLAFVYDGVTVYNSSGGPRRVLDVPWYVILNFAIGGPWPKPVNDSTVFPAETRVDYVRASIPK
jgi:beta-glucanase (GH16 family)